MVIMVEIAGKGGICHYTYNLCRHLSGLTEVTLFTGKGYELKGGARGFRVEEAFDRYRTSPAALLRFMKIIRAPGVRVIHFQLSQHPAFVLILMALARAAQRTVTVTAHNVVSHETSPWERAVYSAIYGMSGHIIVHAESNKKELLGLFPSDPSRISVIPHGNYMFFNGPRPAEIPPAEGQFNVLFFGYIRAYKGLMHLIRAFRRVKQFLPRARLLIVGRPVEDFSPYRKEIVRLGLDENVETELSYVPFEKVRDYFIRANVVVLPYLKVYQSGVLQLAYGFSRPVIATDTGGMAEAVEDGRTGYIVPCADENALSARILEVLSDTELQRRMGSRAFDLAATRFSWEEAARKTLEVYGYGE